MRNSSSGAAGSGGQAGNEPISPGTCLTVEFTTVSPKGKYSPRNIGAIWITDGNGAYVKTLEVWAGKRAKYLNKWTLSSGGDRVDAVSSATLSSHVHHKATWSCIDKAKNPVAGGAYVVHAELTDYDGPGKSMDMPIAIDLGELGQERGTGSLVGRDCSERCSQGYGGNTKSNLSTWNTSAPVPTQQRYLQPSARRHLLSRCRV